MPKTSQREEIVKLNVDISEIEKKLHRINEMK